MSSLVNVAPAGVWQSFRGLHLRTHPDADVAASKVMLVHADEIVMHDGMRVADWDRLVADIASAGAGGLDTGSEAASTWYEIHAIRKSSDGTKNLLLHRAKDYFLDEQQTTDDAVRSLRLATGTATDKLAQGFKVDTTGAVEMVDALFRRLASPTGRFWFTIEADSGGNPSGTPLATSDKLDVSLVSTSSQWIRFVFRSPATLTAATQYHLVLQGDYTRSDTDLISWRGDDTNSYANGSAKAFNGTSWSDNSGAGVALDYGFKVYVTRNDAAVTMPSGYDQRALVGYVYNSSGSNFRPFIQEDRHVGAEFVTAASGVTATMPTLTDLATFVPPVPVLTWWGPSNNTDGQAVKINPMLHDAGSNFLPGGIYWTMGGASYTQGPIGPAFVEYQHAYLSVGGGSGTFWAQQWRRW